MCSKTSRSQESDDKIQNLNRLSSEPALDKVLRKGMVSPYN